MNKRDTTYTVVYTTGPDVTARYCFESLTRALDFERWLTREGLGFALRISVEGSGR